ncbi:MAG: class E sortase [Actinomycetes bacterium]
MTAVGQSEPRAEPQANQGVRGWRLASRTLGEIFITLGCVLLLFVGYQLWWTNVTADHAATVATQQLQRQWAADGRGTPIGGREYPANLKSGQPFALLYIPRLGRDWREPVIQGVSLDDLAKGVGHYPSTAMPGKVGNFSVAGHRATNGEPFAYLDQLRAGDLVVVETRTTFYTYKMDDWYLVAPTQVDVIEPVPSKPGAKPTRALITLTTCNPRWASYQRLIAHGVLVESRPKADGPPPALGQGA